MIGRHNGAGRVAIIAITIGLTGCTHSSAPGTPTPLGPAQGTVGTKPNTYTLLGLVFLDAPDRRHPLSGVRAEETTTQLRAITGSDGRFTFAGLVAATHTVAVSRWDVVSYTQTLHISGHTQLEISLPTYTLSGVVFEQTSTGTAPIEGVEVYCDGCGSPVGHTFSYTDANGEYRLDYTYSGTNPILVRKAGYADPPDTPRKGSRAPVVHGNTRYDIELVKQ